jgi:hypothetical protein
MGIVMKVNGIMISLMERGFMRVYHPRGSIRVHGSKAFYKERGKLHIKTDHNTMDNFTPTSVKAKAQ